MRKILVAEDEQNIREFVVINLERAGYKTYEAETGDQALELYDQENGDFDVAVLDIMMPGEHDGLAVCKELRRRNPSIGIILLSARTQEMDKVSGLMMGADDYVTKPFSPSELVARVDAVYRRVALAAGRREGGARDELHLGGVHPEPAQPLLLKGQTAHRADPGGVSDYGILLLPPRGGPGPGGYFKARLGRRLHRRGENRGREHPPPAHEGGGGALQPPAHRHRVGPGLPLGRVTFGAARP